MKLKTHRATLGGTTQRPSIIDAGHRVQPNSQMAATRHFRLGVEHVKQSSATANHASTSIAPRFANVDRNYLRALRAAEMKAWLASGGDVLHSAAVA